jgi:hypothetical protein
MFCPEPAGGGKVLFNNIPKISYPIWKSAITSTIPSIKKLFTFIINSLLVSTLEILKK